MPSGLWIGDAFARGPTECEPEYAGLWEGLVGCWVPQMGPTGDTLLDLSGYRNHGTLTNMDPATDWVTQQDGWALDFDGSNDHIDCGQGTQCSGAGPYYIAARIWCSPSQGAGLYCVVGKCSISGADGYYLARYQSDIRVVYNGPVSAYCQTVSPVAASTWLHVIGSYDPASGECGIWLDGVSVPVGGDTNTGIVPPNTYKLTIGARNNGANNIWLGQTSNVTIWRGRYMSASEIAAVAADPLCFLRPRRRWWAVAPAAAGVYRVRRYHDRLFAPGLSPGVM
jgi:hypothetical protein